LQSKFLPSPEGLFDALTDPLERLGLAALLFTLAISPGMMEELVFRGACLGLLRRCGSLRSAIVASSAFFALMHLSIYRFVPTFLIGALLSVVVWRSGSIFPAMLLHAVYNGVAVAASRQGWESALDGAWPWGLSLAALAAGAALMAADQSPSMRRPNPPT
jgi:membrane protease YdiL (CAAX protease family)